MCTILPVACCLLPVASALRNSAEQNCAAVSLNSGFKLGLFWAVWAGFLLIKSIFTISGFFVKRFFALFLCVKVWYYLKPVSISWRIYEKNLCICPDFLSLDIRGF